MAELKNAEQGAKTDRTSSLQFHTETADSDRALLYFRSR